MAVDEAPYTANEDLYWGVNLVRVKGSTVSGEEVKTFGWKDKVSKADNAATAASSDSDKTANPPAVKAPTTK